MTHAERRGLMFVLSSPSGAGKSTLARALLESDPDISMSVSATTRPMRAGEVEGRDYYFVDPVRFDAMVSEGAFLEWAKVFDNRYGTPRAPVEAALDQGRDVLFDIDWQGTQQLHQARPEDLVRVFILPPSIAALHTRLQSRAQDSAAVIAGRMARAAGEISHWAEYDYVLVNDDLSLCLSRLRSILAAERLKRRRQTALSELVRTLMAEA